MKVTDYLLNKYNIPVPRYTSYPPANYFSDSFMEGDFLQMLDESNKGKPENIAIYIHIPFCKKICFYCGCNACAMGKGDLVADYMNALKREIEMMTGRLDKTRLVSQIHYGGGTPNSISARYIAEINEYLFSKFSFIENPEIAIECNPAYLDYGYLDTLIASGFNRFSLGIQDFDKRVLKAVNREPSAIAAQELFSYLKSAGKDIRVNMDFIYGLPLQTPESFLNTINKAISIGPDRLVTFSYAHVPWIKRHQLKLERRGLPAAEIKMEMFLLAWELLESKGYRKIGLDHFVLPGDDLYDALSEHKLHRNFQGYCTRRTTGQVYAYGITAISQIENGFSQNVREIPEYISLVSEGKFPVEKGYRLNRSEKITGDIISEIMCNRKLDYDAIANKFGLTTDELKLTYPPGTPLLKEFETDGLITFNKNEILVTEAGSLFIRNIASAFDSDYISKSNTYSKTV